MKVKREASIEAIMKKEGVSREEATELLETLLDSGLIFDDDTHTDETIVNDTRIDESVGEENRGEEPAYQPSEEELLVDELIDNEMARDLAREEQDPEIYRAATLKRKEILARMKKRALDPMMAPAPGVAGPGAQHGLRNPGGQLGALACPACGEDNVKVANQNDPSMPSTMQCDNCGYAWQEQEQAIARKKAQEVPDVISRDRDLYSVEELDDPDKKVKEEAYNILLAQFPDADPEVINVAVNDAFAMAEKEGLQKDAKYLVRVAQMYAGLGDAQALARFAYILAKNSGELDCPLCHSKVARKRDNPLHFYCPNGHVSKLSIHKAAAPADLLEDEDVGTSDNPLDVNNTGDVTQGQPEPQPQQTGLSLSQDERNRLNGVLYQLQDQAATPFMILGCADGFFDQDDFAELCQSQEDLSEYQFGRREGKQAKGGDFTPGVQ